MGLLNYFVPKKGSNPANPTPMETPMRSSAASIFSGSDESPSSSHFNDEKCEIMVEYLHQQQQQLRWMANTGDQGVIMKKARNSFTCCPKSLEDAHDGFKSYIEALNVKVCHHSAARQMVLSSNITRLQ